MHLLKTADSAAGVAALIAERTSETLSGTAKRLYTALVATAVDTAKGRGYSPGTSFVTLHLPLEVLADVCGIHRVTAWRNLKPLKELGLIDYRSHYGSLRGQTRITGTLFQVRLNPVAGSKARLSYDDLKHKWRDLDRDVKRKRTAYRQLRDTAQQSVEVSTSQIDISRLLAWTLPPQPIKPPLKSSPDSCTARQASLETLLDVKSCPKEERNSMVQLAAQALAQALSDRDGLNFYRRLLWQLLRRYDATGQDYTYQVFLAAQRAAVDAQEWGELRRPGALFVSRLKQAAPWWDEVMRSPPTRVGTAPLN
jgi:hypothetical protein